MPSLQISASASSYTNGQNYYDVEVSVSDENGIPVSEGVAISYYFHFIGERGPDAFRPAQVERDDEFGADNFAAAKGIYHVILSSPTPARAQAMIIVVTQSKRGAPGVGKGKGRNEVVAQGQSIVQIFRGAINEQF